MITRFFSKKNIHRIFSREINPTTLLRQKAVLSMPKNRSLDVKKPFFKFEAYTVKKSRSSMSKDCCMECVQELPEVVKYDGS